MLRNLFANLGPRHPGSGDAGCARVRDAMLAYVDQDLSAGERTAIDGHLERCAACRAELAACRRAEAALGAALGAVPPAGDLRPEFYARLAQTQRQAPSFRWGLALPALACAALVWMLHGRPAPAPSVRAGAVAAGPSAHGRNQQVATNSPAAREPQQDLIGRQLTGAPADSDSVAIREKAGDATSLAARRSRQFTALSREPARPRASHRIRSRHRFEGSVLVSRAVGSSLLADNIAGQASDGVRAHQLALGVESDGAGKPTVALATPLSAVTAGRQLASRGVDLADGMAQEVNGRDFTDLSKASDGAHLALATLSTELHVSDENRNFMSSTALEAKGSRKDLTATVRIDDDNATAQEPVELPALP